MSVRPLRGDTVAIRTCATALFPAALFLTAPFLTASVAGCGTTPEPESADDKDGGALDAGPIDAGSTDTATNADAGPADTGGSVDSGSASPDSEAAVDAGPKGPPPECQVNADCAHLDDGDPCNGLVHCHPKLHKCGVQPGTAVLCPTADNTVCATSTCDPKTGKCALVPAAKGTPCIDADPCTVDSSCNAGACEAVGKASWCQCHNDTDCTGFEDGNPCNGTLYCDKKSFPYTCRVNAATVVTCSSATDTACAKVICNKASGTCKKTPVPDGAPCSDGNLCSVGDACAKGACKGVNACACQADADCAKQEDGNPCNGTLYCDTTIPGQHACKIKKSSVVSCPAAATECMVNACVPKTGKCAKSAATNGVACTDGDKCTVGDVCLAGTCKPGTDTCGCKSDAECAGKDDGNLCNGVVGCNKLTGDCELKKGSEVSCDSAKDTACLVNACAAKTAKCAPAPIEKATKACVGKACRYELNPPTKKPITVLCDDGDKCTVNNTCADGKCTSGTTVCECKVNADCAAKDDGNKCNGVAKCDKSGSQPKCAIDPASIITCPKGNDTACTKNTCNTGNGVCSMLPLNDGTKCNDGDACTTNDVCTTGKCNGKGSCGPKWSEVYAKAFANEGCSSCHGSYNGKNATYNTITTGFFCGGKLVVPGDVSKSTIISKVGQGEPLSCGGKMPKKSPGINNASLALLKAWIKAGAKNN